MPGGRPPSRRATARAVRRPCQHARGNDHRPGFFSRLRGRREDPPGDPSDLAPHGVERSQRATTGFPCRRRHRTAAAVPDRIAELSAPYGTKIVSTVQSGRGTVLLFESGNSARTVSDVPEVFALGESTSAARRTTLREAGRSCTYLDAGGNYSIRPTRTGGRGGPRPVLRRHPRSRHDRVQVRPATRSGPQRPRARHRLRVCARSSSSCGGWHEPGRRLLQACLVPITPMDETLSAAFFRELAVSFRKGPVPARQQLLRVADRDGVGRAAINTLGEVFSRHPRSNSLVERGVSARSCRCACTRDVRSCMEPARRRLLSGSIAASSRRRRYPSGVR